MEVLQHLMSGFAAALTPSYLLFCLLGVTVGTLVGILPGIGTSGTIAILLPITFGMDPTAAMIMFAGIYYGAQYGGTITSILVAVPGESSTVVTILEGYPMAKQGLAGKALGMAAIGSWVATTLSVIALTLMAPPLAESALSFGPPEYFALILLAMIMLTMLGGESVTKAMASTCIGLLLGTVGVDPVGGYERFTYGQLWLMDGIRFVIVAMGFFAVSEVLVTAEKKAEAFQVFRTTWRSVYPTWQDILGSKWPMLRGSLIGFVVGVLPGAGATIASFMAYGVEKRVSKHPETFGTGVMEGLVAPESANNAATGGALVPMIALGVPGSGATAMMLGAMMMYGLRPGPLLMQDNPEFVWALIASMYIGNIFLLILNLPLVPVFAAILRVPYKYLYPFIILFTMIGVYSLSYSVNDLALLIIFSAVGYFMRKAGLPAAPAVLALILGPMVERSLSHSLTLSHGRISVFFERPISVALLTVTIIMLLVPAFKWLRVYLANYGSWGKV